MPKWFKTSEPKYHSFYICDFETTSEKFYKKNGYTKIWLWGIVESETEKFYYGETIDTFLDKCIEIKKKNQIFYFHNLKFDSCFLIAWLYENNYNYQEKLLEEKCFNTLIGNVGQIYQLQVKYKGKIIKFQDSYKLLPFSVDKIGKDFNLGVLKERIDYEKYEVNNETLEYLNHDCLVVARALKELKHENMLKMTSSGSSYYLLCKSIKGFENIFKPVNIELLDKMRLAYRGGFCYVNSIYESKVLTNVYRYDFNSMYPSIMAQKRLPYGKPIECKTLDECMKYHFSIFEISIDFKLKDKHIPSLLKKSKIFGDDNYYIESDSIIKIVINNLDYELLVRNYDIFYLKFECGWGFHTMMGIFSDYVNEHYKLKNELTGAKKQIEKLKLNQPYGKFGTNHKIVGKYPIYNDKIRFEYLPEKIENKYYLPVAIAICGWGHKMIHDLIQEIGYENFVYSDTDSIHSLIPLNDKYVDNKELGKLKLENIEEKAKYIRQKTYITLEDGKYHVTACGMTNEIKEKILNTEDPFKIFEKGLEVDGKLQMMQVKGGCILCETSFKIRL